MPNGYTKLLPVDLQAEAQMLESVAGYAVEDVRRELLFAFSSTALDDVAALRWLACLCARRVADLEAPAARLEYLRGEIRAERVRQAVLVELQGLAEHIHPSDVELLEWAGVPEFPTEAGEEATA